MEQIIMLRKDEAKGLIQLLSLASRVAKGQDYFTDKDAYYIQVSKKQLEDLVENGPVYNRKKLQIGDGNGKWKLCTKEDEKCN